MSRRKRLRDIPCLSSVHTGGVNATDMERERSDSASKGISLKSIPKLRNAKSFRVWKIQVTHFLTSKNLLKYIQSPRAGRSDQFQDSRCFSFLLCLVSSAIADELAAAPSSYEAWQFLVQKCEGSQHQQILTTLGRLQHIHYTSLSDFLTQYRSISRYLLTLDDTVTEAHLAVRLIAALPKCVAPYRGSIVAYWKQKKRLTVQGLFQFIQEAVPAEVFNKRTQSSRNLRRKPHDSQHKQKMGKPKEHRSRPNKRHGKQAAAPPDTRISDMSLSESESRDSWAGPSQGKAARRVPPLLSKQATAVACSSSTSNKIIFLVDCGASNHYCGDLQYLTHVRTLQTFHKVEIANGQIVTVKQAGDMFITFGSRSIHLKSVYFVPEGSNY